MEIIIAGGGFAGMAAARGLDWELGGRGDVHITLLDRSDTTVMLPSLPDVAGERLLPDKVTGVIRKGVPKGIGVVRTRIRRVDLSRRVVEADGKAYPYDYLILATGSASNFYGFNQHLERVYTVETVADAVKMRDQFKKRLASKKEVNLVVSGAGFTGMEVACSLYRLAKKMDRHVTITLVEKMNRLVPGISENLVAEIEKEAARMGFHIMKNDSVEKFDGETIVLQSGKVIPNSFFCWCSGVRSAVPLVGNHESLADGRILVEPTLRISQHPEVFVAGDAAEFMQNKACLRRGVNFASAQGDVAARNVAAALKKEQMKVYKPFDMGWVIPLNRSSVGVAFGVEIKGRFGIFMHYLICGVKNYSVRNFLHYCGCAFRFALQRTR